MKKSVAFAAVVCSISTLVCGSVSVNAAGTAETVVETSARTNEETSTETETGTEDATEATETESTTEAEVLEDGTYSADFNTDSSMFHVNEACEGKGTLTVKEWRNDHPHQSGIQKDPEPVSRSGRGCQERWS